MCQTINHAKGEKCGSNRNVTLYIHFISSWHVFLHFYSMYTVLDLMSGLTYMKSFPPPCPPLLGSFNPFSDDPLPAYPKKQLVLKIISGQQLPKPPDSMLGDRGEVQTQPKHTQTNTRSLHFFHLCLTRNAGAQPSP